MKLWSKQQIDTEYVNCSMAAKDIYHDVVKQALIKDGWIITDEPLTL